MLVPLAQGFTAAELPILRKYELTMWSYVVLIALADNPIRSQAQLATEIGADKTRIIPTLDALQARNLIDRSPDPADRRVHVLSITDEGARVCRAAQAEIQDREELFLSRLRASDRRGFLRALDYLSSIPMSELSGDEPLVVDDM